MVTIAISFAVGVVCGAIFGVLFGRQNAKEADMLARAAEEAKQKADSFIKKAKG